MSTLQKNLEKKFEDRSAMIAILGMGYVGLPLAVIFADAGFNVVGIDPDERKIKILNKGKSYISDVPSEHVERLVKSGKLKGTTDFSVLQQADGVSVCVPTPLRTTKDPDLSYILSATEDIRKYLHPGMAIVLESTTYPGTTRELMLAELTKDSDLKAGEDFFLAFSPERVDPGREDWTTQNTPKVLGGITETCSDVCTVWYRQALETVVRVTSAEVAEMTKLLENTFRMVNISFVNEMTMICERLGVDIWEVIDAAATKPFGFMKFTPGPGIGGHCIAIDPLYLSWKMKSLNYNARFIELSTEINAQMPEYAATRVQDALNSYRAKAMKGSKVLVLGAAYKPDIDDLRESPSLELITNLFAKYAEVSYHDPHVPQINHDGWSLDSVPDLMAAVAEADAVVISTNHSAYDYQAIHDAADLIIDTRNALAKISIDPNKVEKL
ncbi:MAG: nucleotide sugar dehydrogenase [Chloroflexota bacterium]